MAKCLADSSLGTAPDTYLYSLAQSGDIFGTIGSDDTLRLFDGYLKQLHKFPAAQRGISCLSIYGQGFATAGRDGLVRCWDTRAKKAGIEISEPRGSGFSSIACYEHCIAAGTESTKEGLGDVSVLLYDTRNSTIPLRSYVESHTDTITQLAFHPDQANILLSASTDGLVSLFDTNIQDEEDALQQVLNPRSAVHCSGYLSSTKVYVVTTDEHFSIYSLDETDDTERRTVLEIGDVREKLDCTYVVDLIGREHPFMACGHNVNETLSIVSLGHSGSWGFGKGISLSEAHGAEIVRDVLMLASEARMMSCGEDGHVKLWDLSAAMASFGDAMDLDDGSLNLT